MPFMSFAQYAKHRGVTRGAVSIAVKEGRIIAELGPNKKLGVYSEKADAQWAANSRAPSGGAAHLKQMAKQAIEDINKDVVEDVIQPPEPRTENLSYNDARTEKEAIQAKLLQLKYDELSGKLVSTEEIEQTWAELATKVKNKILGIASKLKQRHPEISMEVYATLDEIHREALEELANETD